MQSDAPARLDAPAAGGQLRVVGSGGQERQAEKLALLLALSHRLSGELDLDRLLATVADTTFQVLNVDRVAILLLDPVSNDLVPAASRSRLGGAEGLRVPQSIARKAVEERVALQTDNAAADERFKGRSVVQQSVRGAMCAPLLAEGRAGARPALRGQPGHAGKLLRGGPPVPGGVRRHRGRPGSGRPAPAEQLQREADDPLELRAVLRAVGGGRDRRAARRHPAGRQPAAAHRALQRHPGIHRAGGVDGAGRDRGAPQRLLHRDGGRDLRARRARSTSSSATPSWRSGARRSPTPTTPSAPCGAALGMQRAVAEINRRWAAQGRPTIGVGIGINHGEAFVGNIGSHRRLEYTVIGDAVNIASRLCAAAAPGEILLTEAVPQAAGQEEARRGAGRGRRDQGAGGKGRGVPTERTEDRD